MPRALIFAPHLRSIVPSMPITTGPLGNSRSSKCSKRRWPKARASQRAQHFVVTGEADVVCQAHDPEHLGDSAFAGRQDRAGGQNKDVLPSRDGEAGLEHRKPADQLWRDQRQMGAVVSGEGCSGIPVVESIRA